MSDGYSYIERPWGKLAYKAAGTGPPLVLLHSLALSAEMWDPLAGDMGFGRRLVAVDLRGHGRSSWDGGSFSVEDMAGDVACLVDELGVGPVDVLGMSMGGTVAVALAAAHPESVAHLVACDTTAWYGPDAVKAWEQRASTAETTPREMQVSFQTDRWFGDAFRRHHPASVSALVGIFLRTAPASHAAACRALGAYDGRSTLERVTAATLAVTGEDDSATPPSMGAALAEGISGATHQVWPGLRHFAVVESPALRYAVRSFLSGDTVPAPTPPANCCANPHGAMRSDA